MRKQKPRHRCRGLCVVAALAAALHRHCNQNSCQLESPLAAAATNERGAAIGLALASTTARAGGRLSAVGLLMPGLAVARRGGSGRVAAGAFEIILYRFRIVGVCQLGKCVGAKFTQQRALFAELRKTPRPACGREQDDETSASCLLVWRATGRVGARQQVGQRRGRVEDPDNGPESTVGRVGPDGYCRYRHSPYCRRSLQGASCIDGVVEPRAAASVPRRLHLHYAACGTFSERTRPPISTISETRPSPRMVAPETPGIRR